MITTITAKLASKTPRYPNAEIQLTVEACDAEWILQHKYVLGAGGHPSVPANAKNGFEKPESLARLILRKHNVSVDSSAMVCRKNMNAQDLTHSNLCVPVSTFQRHLPPNEHRPGRTISLTDYLAVFSIQRPEVPEAEPCFVPVLDIDTAKQEYIVADADDAEWMTGMPVRFSEKGYPMVQKDWGKWTPLMHEQARRGGAGQLRDPVVFRLNPPSPRDVRKHFIAIVTCDRAMTLA